MTKFYEAFERGDFDDYEHHEDEIIEIVTCKFCKEKTEIKNMRFVHKLTGDEMVIRFCLSCSEIQETK